MNTQAQQIDTKQSLTDEVLNSISLVEINSETLDIVLFESVVGYVIYTDTSIEANCDYELTESQLDVIETKVNQFLGVPVVEEKEQYTSYDQMYGVNNAMFI